MHGLIFTQLRKFVIGRLGAPSWVRVTEEAGLAGRTYLPVRHYPDTELNALFDAAATVLEVNGNGLLLAFGEALVPDLMELSRTLLKSEWKTLEVVAEAERTIHRIVKVPDPKAPGVRLTAERRGEDEIVLHYSSARRLCGLAAGIVQGLGRYFGEAISVTETRCMHRGHPECVFTIKRG